MHKIKELGKIHIPFLTAIMKRYARNRLRQIMRGYRFLKKTDNLGLVGAVRNELIETRLCDIDRNAVKLFFGAGVEKAELITRQYLLTLIGNSLRLNKALLFSLGSKNCSVVYPMPRLWQRVVEKHGFSVARIRCSLLWIGFVLFFWCYGAVAIIKEFYYLLRQIIWPQLLNLGCYAYFMHLTAGNLPQPCRDGCSHDIVTWYSHWKGKPKHLDILCHSVAKARNCHADSLPVMFNAYPVPPLDTLFGLVRFVGWALAVALYSALSLLRGRWWYAILLAESAVAARARFQAPKKLARDYMFHVSGWLYRPLWTYEAEKKGSRILFYFYSTNCEIFKRTDGYPLQAVDWRIVNWPMYLVWDEYQADFLRRAVSPSVNVEVVGPIWFHSSSIEMYEVPACSVAVFDVQPKRDMLYQTLCASEDYYIPKVANQFLLDIQAVLSECGCVMVHKRKRRIGNLLHPKYKNLVKTFKKFDDIIFLDPGMSAVRVIESCFAVISMPFTSTALLARELGKPSVYYDPVGIVQKDDRAAHGVQVLCGKDELRGWLLSLFKSAEECPQAGKYKQI